MFPEKLSSTEDNPPKSGSILLEPTRFEIGNSNNGTSLPIRTFNKRPPNKADEETSNDLNGNNNGNDTIDIDLSKPPANRRTNPSPGSAMDMNMYATRKTIAQGILDLGLMCANASQLKYVLLNSQQHKYFQVTVTLIVISILMQIVIGVMFIALGRLNINYGQDRRKADMINNVSVIVIFLVTVTNVLITAFGPSETIIQSPYANQGSNSGKLTSWTNLYPGTGSVVD